MVPEKQWLKKNGRVVTQATRELFDRRAKEYIKKQSTADRRKRWNKVITDACTNDFRKWVSDWVEVIEKADHKGDTKTIYGGVKTLSGAKQSISKRPTMREAKPASCEEADPQLTVKFEKHRTRASTTKAVTKTKQSRASAAKAVTEKKRRASTEAGTRAVKEKRSRVKTVTEEERSRVRISDPQELAGVCKSCLPLNLLPLSWKKQDWTTKICQIQKIIAR